MRIKNLLISFTFITLLFSFFGKNITVLTTSSGLGQVLAQEDDEELTEEEEKALEEAQKVSELEKEIEELEKKLTEIGGQKATLQGEIASLDAEINLNVLKIQQALNNIAQKEKEILQLADDIDNLKGRIENLVESIDYQKVVLNERLRSRYKTRETSPLVVFLGADTVNGLIQKAEYLRIMEKQDQRLLDEMNQTKTAFTIQKDLFEDKKTQEEQLKAQLLEEKAKLDAFQAELDNKKVEKQQLLNATQNDEAKYQQLLEQARKELQGYKNFTTYAGGGVIGANAFGKGDEGWYMSQRDERWAGYLIGRSNDNIIDVGCLVTSVAMVQKSYGQNVDPTDIAGDNSNFFSHTAMMLIPWPAPSGKNYTGISVGSIDNELDAGRPVIVGVYHGPYGTHFLVLSEKDGNDYIMYDPWYGPDLSFSDYYSKSSIFQAVVFK